MVCDRCNCYFSFWDFFCPFTVLTAWKIKISKKMKKKKKKKKKPCWRYHHFNKCTKNYDHLLYCSLDMVRDRCNYFSFRANFCPFTPLTAQKIKTSKKPKNTWRYHFTHVYQKLWLDDVRFLKYGARRTDGRKKMDAPPKKNQRILKKKL